MSEGRVGRPGSAYLRKVAVELATVLLHRAAVYRSIRALTRHGGELESVFLMYPAQPRYAAAVAFPHRIRRHVWEPGPAGLLVQEGRMSVVFAISADEPTLRDQRNSSQLAALESRMQHLRALLGAQRVAYAGILPGLLAARGLVGARPEADVTAELVAQAVRRVARRFAQPPSVVVLGARGYVGRRLVPLLRTTHRVYCVDRSDSTMPWPDHLTGSPTVLVNVADQHAVAGYLERLWPGLVLLNEAYPEPSQAVRRQLHSRGVQVFHVAGAHGRAIPTLPGPYAGAVPCCAATPAVPGRVVVRQLEA